MATSTFVGRLAGARGKILELVLVDERGNVRSLSTTKVTGDDGFSLELGSPAASAVVSALRAGKATLQLELQVEGSPRLTLPTAPWQSKGKGLPKRVDLGELAAPTRATGKAATSSRVTLDPLFPIGGSPTPLDGNALLAQLRLRDTELNTLRTQMNTRDSELTALRAQVTARDSDLLGLRNQLQVRDNELSTLRGQIAPKDAELGSLRSQVQSLAAARDQAINERANISRQLADRDRSLTDAQNTLKTTLARIDALSADFAKSQDALNTSTNRIRILQEELDAPGRPVPLTSVIEGLGGQVAASASNIDKVGGWSLSDVRVQLKMMVTDGGTKVHFPKPGETQPGAEASAVDFVLRPKVNIPARATDLTVPNVVGYSPLVAERKLRAMGLTVTTSYQTIKEVAGAPKQAGRVLTQRPTPGGKVAPAGTVELLIGKT